MKKSTTPDEKASDKFCWQTLDEIIVNKAEQEELEEDTGGP